MQQQARDWWEVERPKSDLVTSQLTIDDAAAGDLIAADDALHVAAAALGGVKYLLTLNCKHIANAHELPRIYKLLDREGFGGMLICTPAEFLGGN